MKGEELKSCPFCGCIELQVCRTNKNACWIRCGSCGSDSESAPSRKKAIANWNRRATPTVATIIEDDEDS